MNFVNLPFLNLLPFLSTIPIAASEILGEWSWGCLIQEKPYIFYKFNVGG